ncbi:unnamed protein product, partial [Medioppia subpectinata]
MKNVIKKFGHKLNELVDKTIDNYSKSSAFHNNNNSYQHLIANRFESNANPSDVRRVNSLNRRLSRDHKPNAKSWTQTIGRHHNHNNNHQTYTSAATAVIDGHLRDETMATDMTLAPIRSLDDYLLSSSRFQLPQIKDLEKWNHRVINNLHYYQTNYFLTAIIIFTLIGIINPTQILLGLLALLVAIAIFIYANNNSPQFMDFKRSHPIISLCLIFGGGSVIVYLFSSVLVFLDAKYYIIINPTQILLGLLALLVAIAIFIYANNNSPQFMDFKRSHPIISLCLIFGGGSVIVYLFSSVLVF